MTLSIELAILLLATPFILGWAVAYFTGERVGYKKGYREGREAAAQDFIKREGIPDDKEPPPVLCCAPM